MEQSLKDKPDEHLATGTKWLLVIIGIPGLSIEPGLVAGNVNLIAGSLLLEVMTSELRAASVLPGQGTGWGLIPGSYLFEVLNLATAQKAVINVLGRHHLTGLSSIFWLDMAEGLWREMYPHPGGGVLHEAVEGMVEKAKVEAAKYLELLRAWTPPANPESSSRNHKPMTPPSNSGFTAIQIARASGMTRQAVHAALQRTEPARAVNAGGKDVAGWRFDDLPLDWKLEITRRGVKRGFENGEAFLSSLPLTPWVSPLPWDRIPKHEQDKAVRLQKALGRALALRGDPATVAGQAERAGLEDYQTEFGYSISARHWRRLLARTTERDGGEENWQRLEIFIDDRVFAARAAKREVSRNDYIHRGLDETIATLENRQSPTAADRASIWDRVFRHYEQQTEHLTDSPNGNRERRLFKASLVHYLAAAFPAGTLCATESSLNRRFDEKLDAWRSKGKSPATLEDKRPLRSGRFRKVEFLTDLEAIRDRAIFHDGSISLAYRLLHEEGKLSKEFCEFYPFDARTAKSEVPRCCARCRGADGQDVPGFAARAVAGKNARAIHSARLVRGQAGDWFNADDVTLNHYFREQLPDGRWRLLRGECLLMTDLRQVTRWNSCLLRATTTESMSGAWR